MVVVERVQRHVGATITVTVTGVLQTVAGKMVFAIPSHWCNARSRACV
jgi:uncharacterized protein YacL